MFTGCSTHPCTHPHPQTHRNALLRKNLGSVASLHLDILSLAEISQPSLGRSNCYRLPGTKKVPPPSDLRSRVDLLPQNPSHNIPHTTPSLRRSRPFPLLLARFRITTLFALVVLNRALRIAPIGTTWFVVVARPLIIDFGLGSRAMESKSATLLSQAS